MPFTMPLLEQQFVADTMFLPLTGGTHTQLMLLNDFHTDNMSPMCLDVVRGHCLLVYSQYLLSKCLEGWHTSDNTKVERLFIIDDD